MKFALRLCGLFLLFICLPAAWGQISSLKVYRIEIKHIGPQAVSDNFIRAAGLMDFQNMDADGQYEVLSRIPSSPRGPATVNNLMDMMMTPGFRDLPFNVQDREPTGVICDDAAPEPRTLSSEP